MSDLIDRQAAIDALAKFVPYAICDESTESYTNGLKDAYNLICQLPTIDAEPVRHGKWIYGNDFHWYTASCNKCGYQRKTDIKAEGWNQWNYCPNCGARMDAE